MDKDKEPTNDTVIIARLMRLVNLGRFLLRWWWAVLLIFSIGLAATMLGTKYVTGQPEFCTSCHIMDKYYNQWSNSKHGEAGVACIECHYSPDEHNSLKVKFQGLGHLFKYLSSSPRMVSSSAYVNDESCQVCHPIDENAKNGEWLTKKLIFAKLKGSDGVESKVHFVHKTHFEEKNWIEGQEEHCSTCHRHQSGEKHMEVTADTCNLCHFKNVELNVKQAKCSLCHEIPQEPFRKDTSGDAELITHQILEERGVACASCHQHNVRGTGSMRESRCLECHENNKDIMKWSHDKKYMHDTHVAAQKANCFSCHEHIEHGAPPEDYDHYDAALNDCKQCHSKPHSNKVLLLSGEGGKGIDKPLPIKHHNMNMNCQACHNVDSTDAKGRPKKLATASSCINCHSEREGAFIKKWKEDVAEFLEEAQEYEAEAVKALKKAKGKVSKEVFANAQKIIADGQENLHIVNAGGGVHNKKYSSLLLDIAIENFEDAIDQLE